ncbi:hypothetical protein [Streptomyces sp. NBC_01618]|uniref:hypothetical protein n=1 Tax=Streptomyces sp. NBC_01618 TaxID=2975900 RepID=UPI0038660269|nr:hypothetical protein OH735_15605 [Streptomyces sp. NBC_01618]
MGHGHGHHHHHDHSHEGGPELPAAFDTSVPDEALTPEQQSRRTLLRRSLTAQSVPESPSGIPSAETSPRILPETSSGIPHRKSAQETHPGKP